MADDVVMLSPGPQQNCSVVEPTLNPLEVLCVVDNVCSNIQDKDLFDYRLVNKCWNHAAVRTLNTRNPRPPFTFYFRYRNINTRFLVQEAAEVMADEILEEAIRLFRRHDNFPSIHLNSICIDKDFLLKGNIVLGKLNSFLGTFGNFIEYLKIIIRRDKFPRGRGMCYVKDCEEVVPLSVLRLILESTPNLKSLILAIHLFHYGVSADIRKPRPQPETTQMYPGVNIDQIPQLIYLKNISLLEPCDGPYSPLFLKEILTMAPNLEKLEYMPCNSYEYRTMDFFDVLNDPPLAPRLQNSLRHLTLKNSELKNLDRRLENIRLETFEVNTLSETYRSSILDPNYSIQQFLTHKGDSLISLKLGDRDNDPPYSSTHYQRYTWPLSVASILRIPRVMSNLKILEINCAKFLQVGPIASYQVNFPSLEILILTTNVNWELVANRTLSSMLPGAAGQSLTLKTFTLIGRIHPHHEALIRQRILATFPFASHLFQLE